MTTTAQQGVFFSVSEKYFYAVKGVRQGPVTLDELKTLAARQELKRADLVWTQGMAAWQRAGSTADIFQGLPPDLDTVQQPPPLPATTPPPVPAAPAAPEASAASIAPPSDNSFFSWYLHVLKNYAVFDGRARRREFWSFVLVDAGILTLLILLDALIFGTPGILYTIYSLAVFIPRIAVGTRRMHDTNRNGWWQLLPIANIIYAAEDGKPGTNRYGTNPKTG